MLIDKKREKMFDNCRQIKMRLDKKLAAVRAILLVPPLLVGIVSAVIIAMYLFRAVLYLSSGALTQGANAGGINPIWFLNFLFCAFLTVFASLLTVFKNKKALKYYKTVYLLTACAVFVLALLTGVPAAVLASKRSLLSNILSFLETFFVPICSALSIIPAEINSELIKKDMELSMLDGYPHFTPTLMRDNERVKKKISKEELEKMTPEERIMYEREN